MNTNKIIESDCPDDAYNQFITLYKESFNKAFPLVSIKTNKKFTKREPWMSTGLLTSLRTKSKLFKKKLKNPTEQNIAL